jgi:hypothetical protein
LIASKNAKAEIWPIVLQFVKNKERGMKKNDARKLSTEAQQEIRYQVVQLKKQLL